jgi:hypothetical protein
MLRVCTCGTQAAVERMTRHEEGLLVYQEVKSARAFSVLNGKSRNLVASPYRESDREGWDCFVAGSRNGTVLHTRSFFDHDARNARDDASLVFRRGSTIVGVLPACLVTLPTGERILNSHPRATYGGFVVGDAVGVASAIDMVELTIAHARSLSASRILVRNPFRIFHEAPSDETDYAMWLCGGSIHSRAIEVAIPLHDLQGAELLATYKSSARGAVIKAQKNHVEIDWSDDYASFWTMLEHNLEQRHQVRPTHTLAEFNAFRAGIGEKAVSLVVARHEGRMIAGAVAFAATARVMHVQYIASYADALHLSPVNLIVHALVERASAQGFSYLNLGTGSLPGSGKPNLGLFAFKEAFGGRGVLRETIELPVDGAPSERAAADTD